MRCLIISFMFISSLAIGADERVIFQPQTEMPLTLSVGEERQIVFPEKVRLGYKKYYSGLFKNQIIAESVYLTAIEVFSSERLVFQGLDTKTWYLITATAVDTPGAAYKDRFVIVSETVQDAGEREIVKSPEEETQAKSSQADYFSLARYASQMLFAPDLRNVEPLNGVRQVPVKNAEPNIYYGGDYSASVLVSYSVSGKFVTAVKLKNNRLHRVTFKRDHIRGNFVAVVPQYGTFPTAPKGQLRKDFGVIYLLSDEPFDVASLAGGV